MGQTLRKSLTNKILLFSVLLVGGVFQGGYGQSTGNIAFVGFNADGDDDFAIVTLADLPADTTIFFTDSEWDGTKFDSGEDDIEWNTGSSVISEGTVIIFNNVTDNSTITVSSGSVLQGRMSLEVSGEAIFAYTAKVDTARNPDTFLAAVSTSAAQYEGTDGTLNDTELSQGTTAILLSENIDVAEYLGDRSGNTQNGYLAELNDVANNWEEYNDSESQPSNILPFNRTDFSIVDPPTVKFTASAIGSSENSGTAEITVKLEEANGTVIDVDVAFLDNSSTVSLSDIDNFSTQTVSFGSGASSGDTETVSVTINDDSEFERTEKAVFQLQNNTEGSIIEPNATTLTIEDNDVPEVVINEIHADPDGTNGDADGNGVVDSSDDEFVEFINNTSSDIDISGWTFSDDQSLRHTFPEGTVIPENRALILFGDSSVSPEGNFGGAIIQSTNESATLSLDNIGDTITLADADGNEVISLTYTDAGNDQSLVRDPEITGDFKDHSTVFGDGENLFSPGTQVDGTPFGSSHAIGIRDSEGWRMISSPVQNATFDEFFGDFWMQGVAGSNDPSGDGTLFSWNEGDGSFSALGNMDDNLIPGKGYMVYVFEDDDLNSPGIQGGFPKIVDSDGSENSGQVNVSVSATNDDGANGIDGDEGWNLLGNPFDTDLSVTDLIDALESANSSVNATIHVWDHKADNGNGDWKTLSDGDLIAPFQAFFVRFTSEFSNTQVFLDKSALEANNGTEFYKNSVENSYKFVLQLHGQEHRDSYSLEFSDEGSIELDRYDAYKLFSLNRNAISLFSTINNNALQKNVLPKELESNLEIPLSFDANGRTSLTFQWDDSMEDIPSEWNLILIDNEQNRKIDLRRNNEYSFNINSSEDQQTSKSFSDQKGLLAKSRNTQDSRFVLSVQPNTQESTLGDLPENVTLKPNYPNPFNPVTTIPYELAEDSDVLLTVWNMIGQKVATLVDGTVEAGIHEETWNASDMPSGIYIARFEVNGTVFTRKMTLIK
jgi:hypothetical protein